MSKVLVIGSVNYDHVFLLDRLPKKNENVLISNHRTAYGGKGANLAIALKRLEVDVTLYAKVGDDDIGQELRKNIVENGLQDEWIVVDSDEESGTAYVFVDRYGNNTIMVNRGANFTYSYKDFASIESLIINSEIVMIQLEINVDAIIKIIEICNKHGKKLIIDAGPSVDIDYRNFKGAYIVSPNEEELQSLLGREIHSDEDLCSAAQQLLDAGIQNVIVKLGSRGSYFLKPDGVDHFQSIFSVNSIDPTAAGDSFMAGLAKGLSDGLDIPSSMRLGSLAGALATTKIGATESLPYLSDLEKLNKEMS